MAWADFDGVDVSYKQLVEDRESITKEDPQRGTLLHQIEFVEKIPAKGRRFSGLRTLLAIVKYNADFADLVASACLKIKALCREFTRSREHAHELIRGRLCVYLIAAIDLSKGRGGSREGPGHQPPLHGGSNPRLLHCVAEAVHSLAFNVERGAVMEWFDLGIHSDLITRIIDGMRQHPDDLPLHISGTWTLLNLCYLHRTNQLKVAKLHGQELVVESMKKWGTDCQMQDKGCGMIRNMAEMGQNQYDIGAVNQVLQAMDSFLRDPSVVANSIGAIRNLAFSDTSRAQICQLGGLKQILTAMELHVTSDLVQEFGLETIWNLCIHPEMRARFVNSPVVSVVDNAIRMHKWDSKVAAEALRAISYLALDKNVLRELHRRDIAKTMLEAMARFPAVLTVQENGMQMLLTFSQHDACQKALIRHRLVGRVLQAMKQHVMAKRIQQDAMGIFLNLSMNCNIGTRIMDKGGVVRVLKVMEVHHTDATIQQRGCGVLSLLTGIPDNNRRAFIAKKGCIPAVIRAMAQHLTVSHVQQYGCDVLANLALNGYSQIQIAIRGGIDQIGQTMALFSNEIDVMERACAALWNLSVTARNQEKILGSGAVRLLFNVLRDHVEHENLQYNCCGALRNLSLLESIRDELQSLNVFPHLVATMMRHRNSLSLLQEACGAVVHLCLSPANRKLFADFGIFPCIRNVMLGHEADYRLQNHCIGALLNLTLDDDNQIKILDEPETIKTVLSIMRRYPTWEMLQERAVRILLHCSSKDENRGALVKLEVAQWVIRAMKSLRQNDKLVRFAGETLRNIGAKFNAVPGALEQ